MPIELMVEWTEKPDGERFIQEAVIKAEEVFLHAYIEKIIEEGKLGKEAKRGLWLLSPLRYSVLGTIALTENGVNNNNQLMSIESFWVSVSWFDEYVVFVLDVFVVYIFPFGNGVFLYGHRNILFWFSHCFVYNIADLFGGFLQLLF